MGKVVSVRNKFKTAEELYLVSLPIRSIGLIPAITPATVSEIVLKAPDTFCIPERYVMFTLLHMLSHASTPSQTGAISNLPWQRCNGVCPFLKV